MEQGQSINACTTCRILLWNKATPLTKAFAPYPAALAAPDAAPAAKLAAFFSKSMFRRSTVATSLLLEQRRSGWQLTRRQ